MNTPDFFRGRLDAMIDMNHPLVILAKRLSCSEIESVLSPYFSRQPLMGRTVEINALLDRDLQIAGSGGAISNRGRARLSIRLMAGLLCLKHACNESDEALVERWAQDVYFQYFCGMEYFELRLPCDAGRAILPTHRRSRCRRIIGAHHQYSSQSQGDSTGRPDDDHR